MLGGIKRNLLSSTHLAGDGSFREKKSSKSFVNSGLIYSLRYPLSLTLKIFDPGVQKLWPKTW